MPALPTPSRLKAKRLEISLGVCFGAMLAASTALAQSAPFTMQPESPSAPARTAPQAQPSQPALQQAPGSAAPSGNPFSMGGGAPAAPSPAPTTSPGAVYPAASNVQRGVTRVERPVLPFELIRFDGELDSRSWTVHLTHEEAAANASFALGYRNAVVVMPEASRLRLSINGETVIDAPISSPDGIRTATATIRPGLLRAGQNIVRLEALQRHRTDCDPRATYELWTEVDSAATKLIFGQGVSRTLRSLEDLPAVGVDTAGITTIRLVAPRIYRPEIRDRLMRLAQLVALRGGYAHPVIQVSETDPGPSPVGTLKVIMGPASELRGFAGPVPEAAATQPLAVMQDSGQGGSSLVVSGPGWNELDTAIGIVGAPILSAGSLNPTKVNTGSWMWPEVPTATGRHAFRFADVGVPTQEFSGRRLRTRFAVNLPQDFYATEYAEATVRLDAAYTSAVRPGSHVDIYVNGNISSTMTITARGDVVRRHTIRTPMRHFKPGINNVAVEVVLLTDSDRRCTPGETLNDTNRFVLFDTSSLDLPDFGRIGRYPDLGTMGAGYLPATGQPTTIVMARPHPLQYSAAATLLARMARRSGEPVEAQFGNAPAAGDQSVLFLGAVDQIPSGMLQRVKVSENLRSIWPVVTQQNQQTTQAGNADFTLPSGQLTTERGAGSTDEIRRRWSESFQKPGVLNQAIRSFTDWVEQTFNLSLSSLSITGRVETPYEPPQRSTLLVAQNYAADGGIWTLVTAQSEQGLLDGVTRLTEPNLWSRLSGRAVALDAQENSVSVQPIDDFKFVQTQPFSLLNLRLVAANWMSINIVQYALLLLAGCTILGAATYLLLKRLGRPS